MSKCYGLRALLIQKDAKREYVPTYAPVGLRALLIQKDAKPLTVDLETASV